MGDTEAATNSLKKRRTFREKAAIEESADNLDVSPPSSPEQLPSRLDCIPSPSYGRNSVSPEKLKEDINNSDDDNVNKKEEKEDVKEDVKEKKKRRSSSRSPKRKRSKSPSKKKRSRSRDKDRRRRKSRSRSRDRRRRSRSRSRDRKRSRSRNRKRSRSRDRKRSRSRDRRRSRRSHSKEKSKRSRSRDRRRSKSPKRKIRSKSPSPSSRYATPGGVCRAVVSNKFKPKEVSTQEVEERLKVHMKAIQEQAAEEAKKINLPGYLNPAMVNVHKFKVVQDKRKLLWSKPKDKVEGAAMWSGAFEDQNNDEKFKRLMGIQDVKVDESQGSKVQESRKVLDDLEKEYEKSRAFQMSRGAGGLTGMGLGFGSMVPHPPQ